MGSLLTISSSFNFELDGNGTLIANGGNILTTTSDFTGKVVIKATNYLASIDSIGKINKNITKLPIVSKHSIVKDNVVKKGSKNNKNKIKALVNKVLVNKVSKVLVNKSNKQTTSANFLFNLDGLSGFVSIDGVTCVAGAQGIIFAGVGSNSAAQANLFRIILNLKEAESTYINSDNTSTITQSVSTSFINIELLVNTTNFAITTTSSEHYYTGKSVITDAVVSNVGGTLHYLVDNTIASTSSDAFFSFNLFNPIKLFVTADYIQASNAFNVFDLVSNLDFYFDIKQIIAGTVGISLAEINPTTASTITGKIGQLAASNIGVYFIDPDSGADVNIEIQQLILTTTNAIGLYLNSAGTENRSRFKYKGQGLALLAGGSIGIGLVGPVTFNLQLEEMYLTSTDDNPSLGLYANKTNKAIINLDKIYGTIDNDGFASATGLLLVNAAHSNISINTIIQTATAIISTDSPGTIKVNSLVNCFNGFIVDNSDVNANRASGFSLDLQVGKIKSMIESTTAVVFGPFYDNANKINFTFGLIDVSGPRSSPFLLTNGIIIAEDSNFSGVNNTILTIKGGSLFGAYPITTPITSTDNLAGPTVGEVIIIDIDLCQVPNSLAGNCVILNPSPAAVPVGSPPLNFTLKGKYVSANAVVIITNIVLTLDNTVLVNSNNSPSVDTTRGVNLLRVYGYVTATNHVSLTFTTIGPGKVIDSTGNSVGGNAVIVI